MRTVHLAQCSYMQFIMHCYALCKLHQVVVFAKTVQCTIQLDVVFALCIVHCAVGWLRVLYNALCIVLLHCAAGWLRVLQPNFFFNPIPAADIQAFFAVA